MPIISDVDSVANATQTNTRMGEMLSINSGSDIRLHRMARRIELKCFARMLGIAGDTLRDIERGRLPVHPETLRKVQEVLDGLKDAQKPQAAA